MNPLVSVLMPCYNSARTLPMALASLLAQTYENWECVLVDDGSTDHPERVVEAAADPRIRYIRLERNMGRGFARQVTLEEARGELIAFLDADDWMYPWRLSRQVEVMTEHPNMALLSAGMAIVNTDGSLAGVRSTTAKGNLRLSQPLKAPGMPELPFAPSVVRRSIATALKFNSQLPTVEDIDFLMRITMNHVHGTLNTILYAYSEYDSVSRDKLLMARTYLSSVFRQYCYAFPVTTSVQQLILPIKSIVYRAAFRLNKPMWLIKRRSRCPYPCEVAEFEQARHTVLLAQKKLLAHSSLTEGPP